MILTILNFLKPLAPYILAVVAVVLAYTFIYNKGKQAGIEQAYEKAIKETKTVIAKMPDCKCNCPKTEPCPDFDKIKGKNITVNVHQTSTVEVNGDSLLMKKFSDEVRKIAEELRLVRAKRL